MTTADSGRLAGRGAIVVGGGSGMGQAVAQRLSSDGAAVAVIDRDLDAARRTAGAFNGFAVAADVADESDIARAIDQCAAQLGTLDIAVNAAGVGISVALLEQSLEQWQRVQNVNLAGLFLCCKNEARHMKSHPRGGVIVNFISTNAEQPGEGLSAYCSSKAGAAMLTRVAAMELATNNIRVVGVGPGLTETPMVSRLLALPHARAEFLDNIPLGRPGKPEDVAALVAFLVSDEASYITGDTIYVDGGALSRRYPSLASRSPKSASGSAA